MSERKRKLKVLKNFVKKKTAAKMNDLKQKNLLEFPVAAVTPNT